MSVVRILTLLAHCLRVGDGSSQHRNGFVNVKRFGQILEGAVLIALHCAFQIGVRGHYNNGKFGVSFLDDFDKAQSVHSRHSNISQDDGWCFLRQSFQRILCRREQGDRDTRLIECFFQYPANGSIIVDDPDSGAHDDSPAGRETWGCDVGS